MRIIAGDLGGRQFQSPPGHRSHPMSEKMRGALFNALGGLSGLAVLDAFSGSGALVFEAASRGANKVTAIEKAPQVFKVIQDNIAKLGLPDTVKATRANISIWSDNNPDLQFDVVIADPPYDDIRPKILKKLVRHLKVGGTYVLSWPGREEAPRFDGLEQLKELDYGDSKLVFFRKI